MLRTGFARAAQTRERTPLPQAPLERGDRTGRQVESGPTGRVLWISGTARPAQDFTTACAIRIGLTFAGWPREEGAGAAARRPAPVSS
ncbi:hypothetical protein GCM10009646_28680 [Streptomyces aureus]